jgi:16S rRNA (cytosine967-C5)-methyltransferase
MRATLVTLRSEPVSATAFSAPSLAQAFVAAAGVVGRVSEGESLSVALADLKRTAPAQALAAAAQDLSYNALRSYGVVDVALERLLKKPLTDSPLRGLLLAAMAELAARPQSAHAVVHQAVEAAVLLGHSRAKNLVNAVMRSFQRRMGAMLPEIEATEPGRYRHPQWWIDALRSAYPGEWQTVLLESNRHPPMVLRVNRRRLSTHAYLDKLAQAGIPARPLGHEAVLLEKPSRVEKLPGFAAGEVSIQDAGAQRAARLLDPRDGMRVLDACAAPGGKTGHILELADCEVVAVDADRERTRRIAENLARLELSARVIVGDCRHPEDFWEGRPFDRILVDAPCSASGVVRRHPDIKWLRRRADALAFGRTQAQLLDALWPVLASDGKLLYATCSVFAEENSEQVRSFLIRHPEAEVLPLAGLGEGQILPNAETDGFFYALLRRRG